MELKPVLKEWRILLLLFFIGISIIGMQPSWVQQEDGYGIAFKGIEDNMGTEFTGGTRILLSLDSDAEGEELRKQAQDVAEVLNLRANEIPEVNDPTVNVVNIDGWKVRVTAQVGDTDETLQELITQEGTFEARVTVPVHDSKSFELEDMYRFERANSDVEVYRNDTGEKVGAYQPGDRFTLDEVEFVYVNQSEETANLEVIAYTGDEIVDVQDERQRTSGRTVMFPITMSNEAADRYGMITSNFQSSGVVLESTEGSNRLVHEDGSDVFLKFYLDGKLKTDPGLRIMGTPGDTGTDRSIQISREEIEDARDEAERIQTVLKSGSLPVTVSLESETVLGSSLGSDFLKVAMISVALALVAVALIVFVRYQRPRIVIPLFITGSSEVLILLGLWFSTAGELTLSAVAGIIAAVGTGVDDQIIITDESGREQVRSWSERMKQAFFVIFTSAASTTGAMVPIISPSLANLAVGAAGVGLMSYTIFTKGTNKHYIAIGALAAMVAVFSLPLAGTGDALIDIRGFATTTIIGILIGISITRPAYSKMLEYLEDAK